MQIANPHQREDTEFQKMTIFAKEELKFNQMKTTGSNPSEIKLELFRFIDNLADNKLRDFYCFFIENQPEKKEDFWNLLSDWEKDDINAGIRDLNNGKHKEINQALSKYS